MAKQKVENEEKESHEASSSMADPKIEAVKQLIFGENMQQYDSEFNEIRATVKKARQELQDEIDETRDALTKLINELRSDTNKKISQLRADMDEAVVDLDNRKLNRKKMSELLLYVAKQISE